jgi:DNA-binding GntR family transcriptional regulator
MMGFQMDNVSTAVEMIRQKLLAGDYIPGDRLGEAEIAGELGISRTPVREALRILSSDGLVEINKNRGARVAEWSEEELTNVFEVRIRLEGLAARKAAERATPEQIVRLEHFAERVMFFSQPGAQRDVVQIAKFNQDFHGELLTIAGSAALTAAMTRVTFVALLSRTRGSMDDAAFARSANHHFEIIAAIKARQGQWAEKTMQVHILSARSSLLQSLSEKKNDARINIDLDIDDESPDRS